MNATIEMPPKTNKRTDKYSGVPNPPWPPVKGPSLAGAAHGLRMLYISKPTGSRKHPALEREGGGRGRCVAVLLGGRSGGHNSAVLASVREIDPAHAAKFPD